MQIAIVSGTNRKGNLSLLVAQICQSALASLGHEARLLDLRELPADIAARYLDTGDGWGFEPFQSVVDGSTHFIFVAPEYNGSIPGILKLFIDACDYPGSFKGKSVLLVGIAAGRGGNQRGLGHLQDILHYFGAQVHPRHLSIARIRERLHHEGHFRDVDTEEALRRLLGEYLDASQR